jgi:hypothetical protein
VKELCEAALATTEQELSSIRCREASKSVPVLSYLELHCLVYQQEYLHDHRSRLVKEPESPKEPKRENLRQLLARLDAEDGHISDNSPQYTPTPQLESSDSDKTDESDNDDKSDDTDSDDGDSK